MNKFLLEPIRIQNEDGRVLFLSTVLVLNLCLNKFS